MASSILSRISNDLLLQQYEGAGNTFLIYDARWQNFPFVLIEPLCAHYEVDGVLLLYDSAVADYEMRMFNPDATEAEFCGNGARCIIRYLEEYAHKQKRYRIATKSGIVEAWHAGEEIAIAMPSPHIIDWERNISLNGETHAVALLEIGNPHAVLILEEIDKAPIEAWGEKISQLRPEGLNVNFVQVHPDTSISVRTFERGVNRETNSCGTGSTASACVCAHRFRFPSPITVHNRSKESLTIHISPTQVVMVGPARRELSIKCPSQYNGAL